MLKNLKKYIPKRKYRERSQLEKRKKLGFLEKKQDYKIRAEDFHQKEKKYKKLKEEARLKNPEEFYFKMTNSKTINGEHMNYKDGKTIEERITNHNKLLNLVNFKKSMQEKVNFKLLENL
jgi:U3 small nucleolar RNA-associated protein 11